MNLHDYKVTMIDGKTKDLAEYKGSVVLIVNTATKCGFAKQFSQLERLYEQYKDNGLVILGFPSNQFLNQEPGDNDEVLTACRKNYGVSFPLTEKVDVKGADIHPVFEFLTKAKPGLLNESIKWNFTKFLVNHNGDVVARYAPKTKPEAIESKIKELLEL
ncbi:glutathione peroxidase [Bacillus shivajii]|uniref:glutathione peroxidase n=1 Tax=Bacillus shivajii TaxID=1983719 RepID=UPI001CFA601C|nr:glutathione peroxidase [Bacillus shivajii]UCZ53605.1 glutathione peroxidase [Bacillus shivajii]